MTYEVTGTRAPATNHTAAPNPDHDPFDGLVLDDHTQSALTACLFSPTQAEHIWWTIMVVDPALVDTPSHIRLVGHYPTEFEAMDASDRLADELNCCLVPGEAPLTTRPLGIEPASAVTPALRAATSGSPVGRPRAR